MALSALLPWEFSPTVLAATVVALAVYCRGWRRFGRAAGFARPLAFIAGVALPYVFLETHLEYLALHIFWLQRVHHLVLHHLAPFLIAVSAPLPILAEGTPCWVRERVLRPLAANRGARAAYRVIQQPVVASVLFVGLIFFWLMPQLQFAAMLSRTVYDLMNASMLIDGILFWWLMVGPEDPGRVATLSYGMRLAVLVAITVPQSVLGAFIAFHATLLYPSFGVCGYAGSIPPLIDQQLAGLNTWVPPGMMSAAGLVVVVRRWMRDPRSQQSISTAKPACGRSIRRTDPMWAAPGEDCGTPLIERSRAPARELR